MRSVSILVAIFIAGSIIFSLIDTAVIAAIAPLWRTEHAVTRVFKRTFEYWRSKQGLIEENISLRERLMRLELEHASLNLTLSQTQSLEELLGRTNKTEGMVAGVLTRPPQSPYDLIVIDAGSREGVLAHLTVSLLEGPVIGKVAEVSDSSAKVRLFSSSGEEVDAVLERHNIPVTLEGRGGGSFRVRVPRETEVVVGDRILSSDTTFSLMAVVEDIHMEPTDSFKEVLAKSPANIFSLRFVRISP